MAKTLEFANLTLTFGTRVLSDLFNEIVLPAFTDESLVRTYGKTTYRFQEVQLLDLGTEEEPEPAIAGRFIKDTVVKREQYFDQTSQKLVADERDMPSAPSVTFTLLLATHKLLYLRETSDAPGMTAFRGTLLKRLTYKYMDFIKAYLERAKKENDPATTKKSVMEEFLPPDLLIIPLSSPDGFAEFVAKFGLLQRVKVILTSVNAEGDNTGLLEKLRAEKNAVGAQKATFIEESREAGLDKDAVVKQLGTAAAEANAQIRLDGKTPAGTPLDFDNEKMKVRVPIPNLPEDIAGRAARSYHEFERLKTDGTIITGKINEAEAAKMRQVFRSKKDGTKS